MTSRPRVIVPPASEPLSWFEAADHIGGLTDDQRPYVESLIKAVRQNLEHRTCRAFLEQTLELTLDYWPGNSDYGYFDLPRATPLVSLVSFTYKDSLGELHIPDTETYVIDYDSTPGRISPAFVKFWPIFNPWQMSAIRVQYVAGHVGAGPNDSPQIPFPDEDIKHAMRYLVAHFYDNRDAVVVGERTIQPWQMELAVASLLVNHELPNIF